MDDITVNISSLAHFEFCARQCGLEVVEGQWVDNRHTANGRVEHRRVDSAADRVERGVKVLRSLALWHDNLGLSGRADVVEVHPDGRYVPVEFKSGTRHGRTADVQLCAQALCLEHMFGGRVDTGFIWYSTSRRRHRVKIDSALRSDTELAIGQVADMIRTGRVPAAPNDSRCSTCQLLHRCIPSLADEPDRASLMADQLLRRELPTEVGGT
jgi:CRISPR-associated exonuclease Cas4